ncbi:MAG: DUF4403 family protein [Bryobacteraceae bacterium]
MSAALAFGLQGCWRSPPRSSAGLAPPPIPGTSEASSVSVEVAFDLAEVASAFKRSVPRTLDSSTDTLNVPANTVLTTPAQVAAEVTKYVTGQVTKVVPQSVADTCKKGGVSGWLIFPCQVVKQAEAVGSAVGPAVDEAMRAVDEAPNVKSPMNVEVTRHVFLDDLDLSTSGNLLQADATLSFDLTVKADPKIVPGGTASCGIGEPRPQVKLGEPMHMHWGTDGKLSIDKEPWTLTWIRPCGLTFAGIDIQDVLRISGHEQTIGRMIDEALSRIPKEIDVTSAFDGIWASAMEPREIVKDVWLSVRPAGAIVSEPFGQGRTLSFTVTLIANPLLSYGDKPKVAENVRPPFEHTAAPADFSVELDSEVSFREIEKILDAQFAGKDEVVAGRKLRIADIEAHAMGTSVVLGVGISKPFRGRLYLSGKPVFDRASGTVRLEDLDYTAETRDKLVKAREWVLHSKTREALRAESVFPLSQYMSEAMAKLSSYDDTVQGVRFSLRVQDPSITQVFVGEDGMHVRAQLKGTAKAHFVSGAGN